MKHLHYQQIGKGSDVILIHGLFGSLENLGSITKVLCKTYRITSVDVRNHGNSFHNNSMSYDELALDIINLMDYLKIPTAHFLGHSMGGKIAMNLAVKYNHRVNKLMVADISPVPYPAHHKDIISGLQSLDFQHIKNRKDADKQLSQYVEEVGIRQFLLKNLTQTDGRFSLKCHVNNIAASYPQIMSGMDNTLKFFGETLFIKGGNSTYIQTEHRDIIQTIFPNSKAKIIQGAGHWLHAEKPIAFNKIILDFLNHK